MYAVRTARAFTQRHAIIKIEGGYHGGYDALSVSVKPDVAEAGPEEAPIPVVPGGATPTEFLALMARGFRVCKLFPANAVGGLAMLKGLAGPLPGLKLCPTGGIDEGSAHEYLAQPNVVCIGGSWMVPKNWIEAGEWDKVIASSAKAAVIVDKVRHA